jgi:DNA-directed RNA polymerase subunit RPC12/RpoP
MSEHQKISLKLVAGPGESGFVSAPPILNASDHTIEYTCGSCGTALMHAEENQVHNLTILCNNCGSYNSTDA